ncbi:sterol carrier protein domain-containing protein [Streptomyces albidoflavus]
MAAAHRRRRLGRGHPGRRPGRPGPGRGRPSAEVTPDGGPAGLALDAAALAALHLGGEQASRLAAAGLATELTPGAARLADTLFRTSAEPWCPDHF